MNITGKVAILSTIIGAMLGASIAGCDAGGLVLVAEYDSNDAGVEAGNEGGCLSDAIESQDDNVNSYCCNDSPPKPDTHAAKSRRVYAASSLLSYRAKTFTCQAACNASWTSGRGSAASCRAP